MKQMTLKIQYQDSHQDMICKQFLDLANHPLCGFILCGVEVDDISNPQNDTVEGLD